LLLIYIPNVLQLRVRALPDTVFQQVFITPGGVIHLRDGANTQYMTGGTAFLLRALQ
jgi:hypothetical protein